MEKNERWLIDGNCDLCRRQKYCGKPCKLHKKYASYLTMQKAMKNLSGAFAKVSEGMKNKED